MNRNRVISIAEKVRGINISYIDMNDVMELIKCYCIEKGKSEDDTIKFLHMLSRTPFISECVQTALEYYEHKFEINKVFDKNNKLIKLF